MDGNGEEYVWNIRFPDLPYTTLSYCDTHLSRQLLGHFVTSTHTNILKFNYYDINLTLTYNYLVELRSDIEMGDVIYKNIYLIVLQFIVLHFKCSKMDTVL